MTIMTTKTKSLILTTLCVVALSACGYQGSYRYKCQDPQNWEKQECNPPDCEITGECWKDLVGFNSEEETGE